MEGRGRAGVVEERQLRGVDPILARPRIEDGDSCESCRGSVEESRESLLTATGPTDRN